MKQLLRTLLAILVLGVAPLSHADGTAVILDLEGAIGVATAEYIIGGIEDAEEQGATLIVIRMDTPGGLVNSMRDIVTAILGSDVPVATYVSPDGARADSAGTYILLASHIAAMAPTTHLGAATPVSLSGDDVGDKPESEDLVKTDQAFGQDVADWGLAHFELAHGIEIDLVDRTAGRDKSDKHACKHATSKNRGRTTL